MFQNLDLSGFQTNFIKWVAPIKNESIENYSSRLIEQIDDEKPVLVGLSFGGIIAVEIAKQISPKRVILISSAKTMHELPNYYRIIGRLNFHKLIPLNILKYPNIAANWLFGADSQKDKTLLKQVINDTDLNFLSWAIDKILNWQNLTIPINIHHIHGTNDHLLPYRYVNPTQTIQNGTHLMILNRAEEISSILNKIL